MTDFGGGMPELERDPEYLQHWGNIARDPTILGFEPDAEEIVAFRGLARSNDQRLHALDSILREAIPTYEQALLEKPPEDYDIEELDSSIFFEADAWYSALGSHNPLEGITEITLRTGSIVERLAKNPQLPDGIRSSMDMLAGTLYHELAIKTGDSQVFTASKGSALNQYEISLNSPNDRRKIIEWIEDPTQSVDINPETIKALAGVTARSYDIEFEGLRRGIVEAMKGDLTGEVNPYFAQHIQGEARRLQSLALNDFLAFLDLDEAVSPTRLLPIGNAYKWFVELAVRNDQIVGNPGEKLVHELAKKQVRRALPREEAPRDNTRPMQLPSMAFAMAVQDYDRTGEPLPELFRVEVKTQTRRIMDKRGDRYVPSIYVLDRRDDITDSAGNPIKYIGHSLLKKWAQGLRRELGIRPEDKRALEHQRQSRGFPYQLDLSPRKAD